MAYPSYCLNLSNDLLPSYLLNLVHTHLGAYLNDVPLSNCHGCHIHIILKTLRKTRDITKISDSCRSVFSRYWMIFSWFNFNLLFCNQLLINLAFIDFKSFLYVFKNLKEKLGWLVTVCSHTKFFFTIGQSCNSYTNDGHKTQTIC